ncbi:glycosyltransferase [Cetobacterium somerae]|uniref:glycosyltransferase n=1 Tax=Cetobacterium somerae TaxID=188913 RepID=UPI00211EA163|nr:glycosyltransferase [Cetobacterium somerae]
MKKKIRITISTLNGGGAEKVLINLLKELNDEYMIDLFLITKQGVYLKEVPKEITINYNFEPLISDNWLKKVKNSMIARYKNIIWKLDCSYIYNKNKKKYDYEIAFLEGVSTQIVSKSKNNNTKKIAWIHTDLIKHRVLDKSIERKIYKKFDTIICVSNQAKESFLELYPEYKKKVKVIYNLINKKEILEKSNFELNNEFQYLNIISVGRLVKAKGYDILLNACELLLAKKIYFKLIILGEGPEENELKKYIKYNKLEEYIKLKSFKENPYPYIKKADIFVLASRYEGFSLVLAEAIVLEKPIIATTCTGPNEILNNGKYGIQVPIENVEKLAEALEMLLLDENKRMYYSKKSEERKFFFDMNKTLIEVKSLFT